MERKSSKDTSHSVERVTLDGIDILLAPTSGDPNETQVERIFAAFAAIEHGEKPSVIISTTTPVI